MNDNKLPVEYILAVWIINMILTLLGFGFAIFMYLYKAKYISLYLDHSYATLIEYMFPILLQPVGTLGLFIVNRFHEFSGRGYLFNSPLILCVFIFQSIPCVLSFIGSLSYSLNPFLNIMNDAANKIIRHGVNILFIVFTSINYISYKSYKKN